MIKNSVSTAALNYLCKEGWSIIPLQGNGSDGKRPLCGIKWSKYCQKAPTLADVRHWFEQNEVSAIGIICGMISGLIVIEFDNQKAYENFATMYPQLLKTFTVTSGGRGLPHLYYRVDYPVKNREGNWGSLRSDGRYVVAAPSTINGKNYRVSKNTAVRYLHLDELKAISQFLTQPKNTSETTLPSIITQAPSTNTHQAIIAQYRNEAPAIGRNNALYRAALKARTYGLSISQCIDLLAQVHIDTKPFWAHKSESNTQRRTEAALTINSAYNTQHSITTHFKIPRQESTGIANQLREKLISEEGTSITARLLDILKKHKLDQKEILTSKDIIEITTAEGLAQHSVRKVLNGKLGKINGVQIITEITHSHTDKKPVRYIDKRVINSKKGAGRPPQFYKMTDIVELYNKLNIEDQHSDPLDDRALRSDAGYRQALHHALLKRCPGQYSLNWLAQRIGRSVRTIQRYNNALHIRRTPVFGRAQVSWERLDISPFYAGKRRKNGITPGYWLQSESGERYPSLRGLAAKLMTSGKRVFACWRMPNHLSAGDHASVENTPEPVWRAIEDIPLTAENTPPTEAQASAMRHVKIPHTGRTIMLPSHDSRGRALHWNPFEMGENAYPLFPRVYRNTALNWSNVEQILPPDDINAEMNENHKWWQQASLLVKDFYAQGVSKRFPVMRGLALKLLKQYGEGAVIYVQRESEWALQAIYDEALHALAGGQVDEAITYLRRIGFVTLG